jgi:hypothetical protein
LHLPPINHRCLEGPRRTLGTGATVLSLGKFHRFIDEKLNNRVNCETLEGIHNRVRVSDRIINSVRFKVRVEIRVTIRFREGFRVRV